MKAGFTLLEILLACAVLAVLAAVAIPATAKLNAYSARMKSVSNLRQIGVAARLYANEHEQQLPGQPAQNAGWPAQAPGSQWPNLLVAYLTPSDPRLLLDPGDAGAARLSPDEVLSPVRNNTGYVYNGFDEFAVNDQPLPSIPLANLANPASVVLLAQKMRGASRFYVSPLLQPLTSILSLCNPAVYDGGALYLFADGSVRYVKQTEYSNRFWLVDKTLSLPPLPLPPLAPSRDLLTPGGGRCASLFTLR